MSSRLMKGPMQRILFLPDIHCPYHDQLAWDTMIVAARAFNPDITVWSGDSVDFYQLSFHERGLWRGKTVAEELDVMFGLRAEFEEATPNAHTRVITWGNHEHRMERFLANRAPELVGMVHSVSERMGVDHWQQVPYGQLGKLGKIYLSHEVGSSGVHTAHQSREAVGHNVVVGHCHRMGVSVGGLVTGETMVGASFGWLGDRESLMAKYAHQASKRGWQHGFGVGYMDQAGNTWLHGVPIIGGRAVLEGVEYMGIEKCGPDMSKKGKKGKMPPADGKKPVLVITVGKKAPSPPAKKGSKYK